MSTARRVHAHLDWMPDGEIVCGFSTSSPSPRAVQRSLLPWAS